MCRIFLFAIACLGWQLMSPVRLGAQEPTARWRFSYAAGYVDDSGQYAGGSEIMHLVSHKGRLFAANGYWMDARWVIPPDGQKQSAQVLRLDAPDRKWQVDLDLGRSNGLGLEYQKGNILKSVTFTSDGSGKDLSQSQTLLLMAAGARFEGGGAVSAWVRDDKTGKWGHTLVRHGSAAGGVRWVPRDIEVYRDKVTGIERVFLLLGNPGIISGVYDESEPTRIRWDRHLEYPFLTAGNLRTRPLAMTQANGSLFFSEGSCIFRRIDGERPRYTRVINLLHDTDTDVGGIRGLTAIDHPGGRGQSLLFLWSPGDHSRSQVKRLDPDGKGGYTLHDEANMADLLARQLNVRVPFSLGAHNQMYPFTDPTDGSLVHLIGFQGNILGRDRLQWKGSRLYGGAMYAIRDAAGRYSVREVNNAFDSGKTFLVSPRAFAQSPFGDDHVYVGGHDSSNKVSDDMAWVMHAPRRVVVGRSNAADAMPRQPRPNPANRLVTGPVYELRIYSAAEDRFEHLITRFREHTDRIFKKHNMQPVGYWLPTDGLPVERRRFVYILKHASRYAAYRSWTDFTNDREWKKVLETPKFRGVLSSKPISIFMTENDYSSVVRDDVDEQGGVYELRTYVANPGKLEPLNRRFREHTTQLFQKHGMRNVGYWTPFDEPESHNTLIYLIHHANRSQADASWQSFRVDPQWRKAAMESERDGKLLAQRPERIFLRALKFSPLR